MLYQQRVADLQSAYNTHATYSNQWWLAAINADLAYANIELTQGDKAPGDGVNVAVIDTGIDQAHIAFFGQTISETLIGGATDENGFSFSHGTAVSSLINARRTDLTSTSPMHGIAWGAAVHMYAVPLGSAIPDLPIQPVEINQLRDNDRDFANELTTVLNSNPDILNLSFGFPGMIENYSETVLRENFSLSIATLAQASDLDKTITVWSAGNQNGRLCTPGSSNCVGNSRIDRNRNPAGTYNASSSAILSGLPARIPELRGHSLSVVSVNEAGTISSFSNRCGIAADWCLAAPGEDIGVASFGPVFMNGMVVGFARTFIARDPSDPASRGRGISGTSFSAPIVAGSLALIKQLFRDQLSSEELVTRLLATANKNGIYADRSIYGQGMLDIGAATSPVGGLTFLSTNNINTASHDNSLQNTQLQLSAAFGYELVHRLDQQQVAAFDKLGAPFWFQLSDFVQQRSANVPLLDRQMHQFLSFQPDISTHSSMHGHLELLDNATNLTWKMSERFTTSLFATDSKSTSNPALGTVTSWHSSKIPVSFSSGWILERESLLGGIAQGAFGQLSNKLSFIGLTGKWASGKWQFNADAQLGIAIPDLQPGLITDVSSLATTTFKIQASNALNKQSSLHILLKQPVKIEYGKATLSYPVGRNLQGTIFHNNLDANLTPTGRQIDASFAWHKKINNSELRLGTAWTYQASHDKNAKPSLSLLVGWLSVF